MMLILSEIEEAFDTQEQEGRAKSGARIADDTPGIMDKTYVVRASDTPQEIMNPTRMLKPELASEADLIAALDLSGPKPSSRLIQRLMKRHAPDPPATASKHSTPTFFCLDITQSAYG